MFSTAKSRIITMFIIVIVFVMLFSIVIGNYIYRDQVGNAVFNNIGLVYKIDNLNQLEEIEAGDYYDSDNLISLRTQFTDDLETQNRRFIISVLIIIASGSAIVLLVVNSLYDRIIAPVLNVRSDKLSDFQGVRTQIENYNMELSNRQLDIDRVNNYIGHELKNSLAILKAKIKYEPELSEDYIDEINHQIDDISALTTNQINNLSTIDLLLICAEVTDEFKSEIDLQFADECNFNINGNINLMKRVFVNIIENAFKYGADKCVIEFYNINDNVVIKISNNGEVIKRSDLDRIFDYKYRIDNLKADGSGIGLALVKNIVELLNGSIYVESNHEQTSFYLSFQCVND